MKIICLNNHILVSIQPSLTLSSCLKQDTTHTRNCNGSSYIYITTNQFYHLSIGPKSENKQIETKDRAAYRAVVRGEPAHPLGFMTTGKQPRLSASQTKDLTFVSMLPRGVPGTSNKVVSSPRSSSKSKFAGQSNDITPPSSVPTHTL